jgi:fibronectin-binding autotransporter adhesin
MRSSKRSVMVLAAATSFVGLYGMSVNRASAANGTPSYLDVNGTTASFGSPTGTYAMSSLAWSTDTTGVLAPIALPTNAQLTVGNNASDFSGANFSINIDLGNGVRGIVVNSNNANVTLVGNANANFNTGGITCTVAAGSTLTWNVTRSTGGNVGFNMSNRDVTFNGGGVNTFITHFMANDNSATPGIATLTANTTINLAYTTPEGTANPFGGGFTMNSGSLNFATAASSNAFSQFQTVTSRAFTINGGNIDNTSGAPMTLQVGGLGYVIGGDFTYRGSNDMDFGSQSVTFTGTRTVTVNGGNLTMGQIFGGTFGLTKAGAGSLILSGNNQYTGPTTINAGVLAVNGQLTTSAITLNNATASPTLGGTGTVGSVTLPANNGANVAHINPGGGTNPYGTLTTGALQVNGGDFKLDLASTNSGSFDSINVTGAATFGSASTITPSIGALAGVYTVLTAGTLVPTVLPTINAPSGSADTRPANYSDAFVGNSLQLTITGGPQNISWGGQNSNAWDLSGVPNWKLNGVGDRYYNADFLTFDDTASTFDVNLSTNVSPGSVTVANSAAHPYTISGTGAITGGVGLTKSNTGALVLANNNTYTGVTTINGGTVQLGAGTTTGSITSDVVNNGTLVFNHSNAYTFNNVISGTGSVYQLGTGTLTLNSNTYTGPTTISHGAVVVKTAGTFGDFNSNGTVTVAGTATYHADTNTVTNDVPGGQIDLSGVTTTNLNVPTNQGIFNAKIFRISGAGPDGTGAIVNNGVNQQNAFQQIILDGDSVVGGTARFDIRNGTPKLDLQGHTLVKIGTNQFTLVGPEVTAGNIVVNGGTLATEAGIQLKDGANPGDNGTIFFNGNNTVFQFFNVTDATSITRPVVINGTGIRVGNNSATPSLVGSSFLLHNNVEFAQIGSTGGTTFSGNISEDTPRTVTKTGNTTITFSGSNTFSGGLNINAGTLQLGSANALNSSGVNAVTFGNTGTTVAALRLNGNDTTISGLTTAATPGPTVVEGGGTLTVNVAGSNTYAGQLQDNFGQLSIVKGGAGILVISGATNTYTGGTTVNAGTLQLAGAGTLNGGSITGTSSGTFEFNRTSSGTFNNNISGAVNILKNGTNTITLTGNGAHTGTTTINSGGLLVNGSLGAGGTVTIVSGGTLGGSGEVGHVDVIAGSGLRPGPSIADGNGGNFKIDSLTQSGGDIRFDIGGGPTSSDQINVTNAANFSGGGISLNLTQATPDANSYVLINAASIVGTPTLTTTTIGRTTFTLQTTATQVKVNLVGNAANLLWAGNAGGGPIWENQQTLLNWKNTGQGNVLDFFYDKDAVTFDNTASNANVTVNTVVSPGSSTFRNSTLSYTFSGTGGIGGNGSLLINGDDSGNPGRVTMNISNTYTGGTNIQNGTLVLGSSNALPAAGSLSLSDGSHIGALDLNGFNASVSALNTNGEGTARITTSGATTSTFTYAGNPNNGNEFRGIISDGVAGGTVALVVSSGSLSLTTATNTYSGGTTVAAGATLSMGNGGSAGSFGSGAVSNAGTVIFDRSNDFTVANALSGAGTFVKKNGSSTMIVPTNNTITGTTVIESGTLQVGTGGASGSLGTASISNNANLVFNRSGDLTVANILSGGGQIYQVGGNTVTFSGNNASLGGQINISNGVVKLGTGSANLGNANVNVTANGALDINGAATINTGAAGARTVTIIGSGFNGQGAIINSGADQISSFGRVVMAGNATIGGTGRWDIRRNTPRLETNGQPYTLTKVGSNQFSLVDAFIDPALGDIHIVQGVFAAQLTTGESPSTTTPNTKPLGDPNYTMTIENGAAFNMFRLGIGNPITTATPIDKKIVINDGGRLWAESDPGNVVGDPVSPKTMTVNGNAIFQAGTITTGQTDTSGFTVNNPIIGTGGITKIGVGNVTLRGSNSYTGTTAVQQGRLIAVGDNARAPIFTGGGADITGGRLVLDYSPVDATNPAATVASTLDAGYDQPTKFSSGALRTSATPDTTKGLGWRDDSTGKQVTVMYTYYGDSDLSGTVNTLDFNAVAANFNTSGNIWASGDFNYDGVVNALDFNAVATNFGKAAVSSQPLGASGLGTLVPEPGTALLGVAAGLGLLRRRRRAC